MFWPRSRIAARSPACSASRMRSRSRRRFSRNPGRSSFTEGSARSRILSLIRASLRSLVLERAPERREQHVDVHRLRKVVARARLDALVAVAHYRLGGDGDDRQRLVAVELAHDAHGVEAVEAMV